MEPFLFLLLLDCTNLRPIAVCTSIARSQTTGPPAAIAVPAGSPPVDLTIPDALQKIEDTHS